MKQYCRYCVNCAYGDVPYCCIIKKTLSIDKIKRVNRCSQFDFCEIDVLGTGRIYKPRQKKEKVEEQLKLGGKHGI